MTVGGELFYWEMLWLSRCFHKPWTFYSVTVIVNRLVSYTSRPLPGKDNYNLAEMSHNCYEESIV